MSHSRVASSGFLPVLFILIVVFALRDLPGVLAPPILVEDGPNMLDFYSDSDDPARIFRFYGGYVSVGPNLIGYLAGLLPLQGAVYALYWGPLILAALTFAALCLPGFRLPGLTQREKILVALALGLFPAGNMALTANATYSLWHFAILVFFMALFWRPASRAAALCGGAVALIAVTSHPVSIILMPVLAWRVWRAETAQERWIFLTLLIAVPAYVMVAVAPDHTAGSFEPVPAAYNAMRLYLERAVFETLFGTNLRMSFLNRGLEPLLWAGAMGLLALMIWLAKWPLRGVVLALIGIGCANSFFSALARDLPLDGAWAHRYGYLGGVMFFLAFLLVAMPWLQRLPSLAPPLRIGCVLLLGVGAGASMWSKLPYFSSNPKRGAEIARLVAAHRADPEAPCLRLERGLYSIEIRTDQDAPCEIVAVAE